MSDSINFKHAVQGRVLTLIIKTVSLVDGSRGSRCDGREMQDAQRARVPGVRHLHTAADKHELDAMHYVRAQAAGLAPSG